MCDWFHGVDSLWDSYSWPSSLLFTFAFIELPGKSGQPGVAVLQDRAEILHRIGDGQGERVGHDLKLDGETPGGLSIHLNVYVRGAVRSALQ